MEWIYNNITTIDKKIIDEEVQYDINRETVKLSAVSWGEINKYKYLTGEVKLPSNQKLIKEQNKFVYLPLRKGFEKQAKPIKDQGDRQVEA